ncbi:hypothetical protein EV644_101365 [Kribbella orskensis]|uniref:Uncharacterized protein n=1 Tax=Kribbella orskensis TaxID=2512216 RepID=A0ABY2BUL6_9ACTN|nr:MULTISPECIES: hypothetical protein [Kribbella]TCN44499.1 hypothetical protein EV642_101624 [Kribbella sp. VKM Ac-2500]TCO31723.1 hypothetical protein EV644_101365 [Kribbella orskensis]
MSRHFRSVYLTNNHVLILDLFVSAAIPPAVHEESMQLDHIRVCRW